MDDQADDAAQALRWRPVRTPLKWILIGVYVGIVGLGWVVRESYSREDVALLVAVLMPLAFFIGRAYERPSIAQPH